MVTVEQTNRSIGGDLNDASNRTGARSFCKNTCHRLNLAGGSSLREFHDPTRRAVLSDLHLKICSIRQTLNREA